MSKHMPHIPTSTTVAPGRPHRIARMNLFKIQNVRAFLLGSMLHAVLWTMCIQQCHLAVTVSSRNMYFLCPNELLQAFSVLILILDLVGGRTTPPIKEEIFSTSSATTSFSPGGQYVMLTFDNGPHAYVTGRILDILRDRNASATFFVQGSRAYDHPLIMKRSAASLSHISTHYPDNIDEAIMVERFCFALFLFSERIRSFS